MENTFCRPPRRLPLLLKMNLYFCGALNQIGWFFLGFGLIFFWAFDGMTALQSRIAFMGKVEKTQGVVLNWFETNCKINGIPVMGTSFSFEAQPDETIYGASYKTGQYYNIGQKVDVEYVAWNPNYARIPGARMSTMEPDGLLYFMILPAIGLVFIIGILRKRTKIIKLLKKGQLAKATLVEKKKTDLEINERAVYKLTFEFTDSKGETHEISFKTRFPEKLVDDEEEVLFYDPRNPSHSTLLGNIPLSPVISSSGTFDFSPSTSKRKAVARIILPFASILGHGAVLLSYFI